MSTHPAYDVPRAVTPFATVVLEHNPGEMTLEGTNTWVLRAPGERACVVVDPGYAQPEHLDAVATQEPVELVLLTHHHADHAESAAEFADRVHAPIRAFDAELCAGADPLRHNETLRTAGLTLRVLHTPGHTADSICLLAGADEPLAILTGDTILGHGTTVLQDLTAYLDSLQVLANLPALTGLPGHGPELPDLAATARDYLAHRQQRLEQVRAALRELGAEATARQIVEHVYADVDPALWPAAEYSVRAQLDYLHARG